MSIDRKFLVWALAYAALGMALGLMMAASHDHRQLVTHAHVLLVGFVASLLYAIVHKLWIQGGAVRLAMSQFVVHQAGAAAMVVGLYLLYGGVTTASLVEPVLAVGSIAVLVGALLMMVMVIRSRTS
jgi:hypothetical protein